MRTLNAVTLFVLILALALNGCAPASPAAVPTPVETDSPAETVPAVPAGATAPAEGFYAYENARFHLDPALFNFASGQLMPAKPAGPDAPYWDVYPEYTRIELVGYPAMKSAHQPVIAVYPVEAFRSMNETAGKTLGDLAQWLAEKPLDERPIPALPVRNAVQALHAKVKYLSFQSGSGVRFLTFYSQGPVPVNNGELFYTFQGLTSDGRYAVSVTMPVYHPDLPASAETLSLTEFDKLFEDGQYFPKMTATLNGLPDGSFTPDLARLDALVESIQIGE